MMAEPTQAAMRAATEWLKPGSSTFRVQFLAEHIDRETGLPELLAGYANCIKALETAKQELWGYADAGQSNKAEHIVWGEIENAISKARAALAKAQGETHSDPNPRND